MIESSASAKLSAYLRPFGVGRALPISDNIETSEHSYYAGDILNHNCDVPKVGAGRNATLADLRDQILTAIRQHPEVKHTKRLNIHYARMGEPTWNYDVITNALRLRDIVKPYIGDSLIHPVVSTMLPKNNRQLREFLHQWTVEVKNGAFNGDAGLQFSINSTDDKQREYLFSGNSHDLRTIYTIPSYRYFSIAVTFSNRENDFDFDSPRYWLLL